MKKCIFYARDRRSGKKFTFGLNDLYGYEGEVEGVFIKSNGMALNYNSGSFFNGMNPDLEIIDIKVVDDK